MACRWKSSVESSGNKTPLKFIAGALVTMRKIKETCVKKKKKEKTNRKEKEDHKNQENKIKGKRREMRISEYGWKIISKITIIIKVDQEIAKLSSPFLVYLEWYQPVRGTFSNHKFVMAVTILQQVYLTPSSKRFNRTLTLKSSTKSFTHILTPTLPKTDSSVTCWQKLSHPLIGGNFLTGSMNET